MVKKVKKKKENYVLIGSKMILASTSQNYKNTSCIFHTFLFFVKQNLYFNVNFTEPTRKIFHASIS